MPTTLLFVFICLLSAIGAFKLYKSKKSITITNGNDAHHVLTSADYSRCKPNQWLINTLSIVNPFTIDSRSLLQGFKNVVKNTLAEWCKDEKYEELVSAVGSRVEYRLSLLLSNNSKLCLSKLVKQVTLDAFLSSILNVHANEDLLTELPQLIIHLWKNRDDQDAKKRFRQLLCSNKDGFSQSDFWQQIQNVLSDHRNVISKTARNDCDEKISNPMNIIVPGWETMWRVVLYSLLELLRRPELLKELRSQLKQQPQSPQKCLLLQCVLKETMRLYPPTKNIYRTHLKSGENVKISIQQIHRDTDIWGSDALEFRPDRFKEKLTSDQNKCYLPFSISCPARHGFAYKFAGAIVTEILHRCPTFAIIDESSSLSTDKLLDITRDSYHDFLIIA